MDEQRFQAYIELIDALLNCNDGVEPEILSDREDIIDDRFVQTMEQVAASLAEEGDKYKAYWLRDIAAKIAEVIENSKSVATEEEYLDFLIEVLQATEESENNPEVIYPLLEANLDKLDENFAVVLQNWASETLSSAEREDAYSIASEIGNLTLIIQQVPFGDRSSNIEIAIAGYEVVNAVITPEVSLQEWGLTQNNMGFAYYNRIEGNRAENLEQAIRCYQLALQVPIDETIPEQWGLTQNNLGLAYLDRIEGYLAQNRESAIAALQAALQVRTREEFPQQWAETQNNLGLAYLNRIQGDNAENIEQAISYLKAAWEVYPREANPQTWATIQNNLGVAYCNGMRGDRSENLELAIKAFQSALLVYTPDAYPLNWGRLQDDLGNAYGDRIRGDWVENQEAAIAAFQSALQVYTRDNFPEDWASTQNNLATIYSDRDRGDKAENLELAIEACENALQVYTREDFPEDWAMAQTNLGIAYRNRIQGDLAENLETAIRCYKAALEEHTRERFPDDWAGLHNNLGNAYRERILGNPAENLAQSLRCLHAALEVYTPESLPQDWAMSQNNLALTYYELGEIDEAIACFRAALEICTPTAFPLDCLHYGGNLGDKAFAAGRWAEAIEGYGVAIEVLEQTRAWVITESRRQEILQEDIDVYQNIIQACVNNGQMDKALEYVERSRSRRIVDLMASNDLYQDGEIAPKLQEVLQQYEALQQQIDTEYLNLNSHNNRALMPHRGKSRSRAALQALNENITALEGEKHQLWEQLRRLDPVLAGQLQVNAPDFAAMQQLINHRTTAILSFYTTANDTYIFILRQNQITCHTCPGQGQNILQDWINNNWLQRYISNKDLWKSQISTVLAELARRLQLNELIEQHLTGIEELIIVPHLYLHQIPFAAVPVGEGEYLADKFLIRYIASCQVLEFCQKRPPVEGEVTYGIVEDATEDLPCASFEGEQISQLHNIPDYLRLKGNKQATVSNYRQLIKQVQSIVSSHHAQSRLDNPLESRLELGDGSITLGQLLTPGWRLPHLYDVFLSCCETGLGVTQITDDILTLSIGFLCAGARSVCSTLWAVDDLATSLFSIFYHHYRQQGKCRPAALQEAQVDLRTLTGVELATRYQPQITQLLERKFEEAECDRQQAYDKLNEYPQGSTEYLKWQQEEHKRAEVATRIYNALERLESLCRQGFPFSHPFYWAAFTCSGLG